MDATDWQAESRSWGRGQRSVGHEFPEEVVEFFRQAFENTMCPERAWFGVHPSTVSLVVGGIYLAAIYRVRAGHGMWLLLDQGPPRIEGVTHRPVKSSRDPSRPLMWANAESLQVLSDVIASDQLWMSYRAASHRAHIASRAAGDRDALQEQRGKRRLSTFWTGSPTGLFPDEVRTSEPLFEGAVRQVTVNAYERSAEARRRCIAAHQPRCAICGVDFGAHYGPEFDGLIHVHHVRPISEVGGQYTIDPVEDLRPVCPNCHAVIHFGGRLRSISEVRALLGRDVHTEQEPVGDAVRTGDSDRVRQTRMKRSPKKRP